MILESGDTARGRAMHRQQVEEYDDERVTAIMQRPPRTLHYAGPHKSTVPTAGEKVQSARAAPRE
jgi:hypothetical protein